MPIVKVAAAAEQDLKAIWAYVAEHNPEAASKLVKEITRRFAILRDHPQMGREQNELLVNLRSFTVKN
jgi:toxin ParE1/3/4